MENLFLKKNCPWQIGHKRFKENLWGGGCSTSETNDQIMAKKKGEGGMGGEVIHKYIFQYSEDCKSEHFPQLWRDINFWKKREKRPDQSKEL